MRKPKRFCPGVRGDICTLCCGTEREETVACPLDCPYLREARRHERIVPVNPDQFPNLDIKVSEEFLHENEGELVFLGRNLMTAALEVGAVDSDVNQALDALIRTYRTLESGVYYETRPQNLVAGAVFARIQHEIGELRRMEQEAHRVRRLTDRQILGLLAFLQHLGLDRNNGRKLGRTFIDFLREFFDRPVEEQEQAPSLIVP